MLEERLQEWMEKVLNAYEAADAHFTTSVNTYKMIVDVDKIIAEEFHHDPVLAENR